MALGRWALVSEAVGPRPRWRRWGGCRARLMLLLLAVPFPVAAQAASELRVDPARSSILVVTHRKGLFSFLGHEHAILAQDWTARVCWNAAQPGESRAELTVDTRTLVIDSERGRELARLRGGPSAGQRESIQRKMLDDAHLAAQAHPRLSFQSTSVTRVAPDRLELKGRLTIRGTTRDVAFPATLGSDGSGRYHMSAALTVKQTDFGIRPESIAGVVKVSDPVDLRISLSAVDTRAACPAARGE